MLKDADGKQVRPGDMIVLTRKGFTRPDLAAPPEQTKVKVKDISGNMISLRSVIGSIERHVPIRELERHSIVRKFTHETELGGSRGWLRQ